MTERFNDRLRECAPDAEIRSWPTDALAALPLAADALISTPLVRADETTSATPPAG